MNDQINNRNIIIWEKWKDPFGYETDEQVEDTYNDENGESITTNVKRTRCNLIQTPFGIIPFNENMASSEIFNFWTGHSNFPITKKISDIIENTDGVETLNIFTKYRFRIAIGKSFKDSIVMTNINNNVYEYLGEYYV
jgi:hypothetical protein